jgi:hypothetical protein
MLANCGYFRKEDIAIPSARLASPLELGETYITCRAVPGSKNKGGYWEIRLRKRNLSRDVFVVGRMTAVTPDEGRCAFEGSAMNSRERAQLRTRLRQVNIAYSSLVRDPSAEDRFARMTALRIERRAIMSLLFGGVWRERREATVPQPISPAPMLPAASG